MEETIIQYMLTNGEYFKSVLPHIKESHFTNEGNKKIVKIIKNYYNDYKETPTLKTLLLEIGDDAPSKEAYKAVIKNIKENDAVNIEYLKNKTEKYIKEKEFYEFLILSAEALQDKSINLGEALTVVGEINKITLEDSLGTDLLDTTERFAYYRQTIKGIETGLANLHKEMGAYMPKTLNIISASSGVGKTLFGASIAAHQVLTGYNVLIVSLEISEFEYFKRIDSNILNVPVDKLNCMTEEEERQKFEEIESNSKLGRLKTIEYPPGMFSPIMLEALLDKLNTAENFKPDIVYIDYITLMKSDRYPKGSSNSNSYFASVAEGVRGCAMKYNLPIVTFSQLTRGSGRSDSEFAGSDNIAYSKAIFETADTVLMLSQTDDQKTNGEIYGKMSKNRNTGKTSASLLFNVDYKYMRVTSSEVINKDSQYDINNLNSSDDDDGLSALNFL